MSNPCQPLQEEVDQLKKDIKSLQEELKKAAGTEKARIIAEIKKLKSELVSKTQALEKCQKNFVETNIYVCDDGGLYYVREIGNNFFWFGERRDGAFANVFFGQREGSLISGRWVDVPKGRTHNSGTLNLSIDAQTNTFKKLSQTGGFGGANWRPFKPFEDTGLQATTLFHKAGFQGAGPDDLTGTWMSDDNGTYYIRQTGNDIVWMGESQTFSNIFIGTRNADNTISGNWLHTPRAAGTLSGTLTMHLEGSLADDKGLFTLAKRVESGGFKSILLSRVESLNVQVQLNTLILHKTNDFALGDEPFLWAVVIKVDGDRLNILNLSNIHATLFFSQGSHGNISSENNIDAGSRLPIPPLVGRFGTTLKTIRGLAPFVTGEGSARDNTALAVLAVALEEDATSNAAIEAGHRALNDALQKGIDDAVIKSIQTRMPPNFDQLKDSLPGIVKNAVKEAEKKIFGFLDPDDLIGFEFVRFSFTELLQSGGVLPISLKFINCKTLPNNNLPANPLCPVGSPRGTILTAFYEVVGEIKIS